MTKIKVRARRWWSLRDRRKAKAVERKINWSYGGALVIPAYERICPELKFSVEVK